MKFAKIVFWVAAVWGVLVLTPLYFMFNLIGKNDPPAITHPGFFYGFIGAALAWQVAFGIIATDPVRFRLLMIPSVLEKFSYNIAVVILVMQQRMHPSDLLLCHSRLAAGRLVRHCFSENVADIAVIQHSSRVSKSSWRTLRLALWKVLDKVKFFTAKCAKKDRKGREVSCTPRRWCKSGPVSGMRSGQCRTRIRIEVKLHGNPR